MTIKEARQAAGLSQSQAAKYLEIPAATLKNWEQGRYSPPPYVEKLVIEKLNSYTEN